MATYVAYRIELKNGKQMHYKTGRLQDVSTAIQFNQTWVYNGRIALLSTNSANETLKLVDVDNPE